MDTRNVKIKLSHHLNEKSKSIFNFYLFAAINHQKKKKFLYIFLFYFRVTANIASAVYCTTIEKGNTTVWNSMWEKYEKALLASDYITIIKALGCSKDEKVLNE